MGGGGGGGGGAASSDMQELMEMFGQELDQMRNQYETVQRGQQEQLDNEVDEALQRLTELARRQQQQIERERAQSAQQQAGGGGGGAADQRQIAEQAEELARQLERLSRENSRQDLRDAANRLQQAAEAMRRAAAGNSEGATADSSRALNELQNARRLLDQNREGRLERDLADVEERLEQMRAAQSRISNEVERLGTAGRTQERMDSLLERKDDLAGEIRDLELQLDDIARESRREQMQTSRGLQQSAEWIRDSKLADKVRYSKGVVQERSPSYAQQFEEGIDADLQQLQRMVQEAAAGMETSESERLADAVEDTRDLVRRLESFERRMRERGEQGQRDDQRGQQQAAGEPREQDQQGQGEQGEQGQQGQQGEQGQGGQGAGGQPGERVPGGQRAQSSGTLGGSTSGFGVPRQFGREFQERIVDMERLREQLAQEGIQTTDLDNVLGGMRDWNEDFDATERGLDALRGDVIDGLKQFEFWLRRVTDATGGQRPQLARTGEVPEAYRALVEEYSRALSRENEPQNQ